MSGLLDDTVGPLQTWLPNRFYMLEILRLRLRFMKVTSIYHLVLFSFYKLGEALAGVMTDIRDRSLLTSASDFFSFWWLGSSRSSFSRCHLLPEIEMLDI